MSDSSTNIASWFELSKAASFTDALAQVGKGPPKKFNDPKNDLWKRQKKKKIANETTLYGYSANEMLKGNIS